MDEKYAIKLASFAAYSAIADTLKQVEQNGGKILDEEGQEISPRVVAIIAVTTLAALYCVEAGLDKERFMMGMSATYDHMEESTNRVQEILGDANLFDDGDNKWVQ